MNALLDVLTSLWVIGSPAVLALAIRDFFDVLGYRRIAVTQREIWLAARLLELSGAMVCFGAIASLLAVFAAVVPHLREPDLPLFRAGTAAIFVLLIYVALVLKILALRNQKRIMRHPGRFWTWVLVRPPRPRRSRGAAAHDEADEGDERWC